MENNKISLLMLLFTIVVAIAGIIILPQDALCFLVILCIFTIGAANHLLGKDREQHDRLRDERDEKINQLEESMIKKAREQYNDECFGGQQDAKAIQLGEEYARRKAEIYDEYKKKLRDVNTRHGSYKTIEYTALLIGTVIAIWIFRGAIVACAQQLVSNLINTSEKNITSLEETSFPEEEETLRNETEGVAGNPDIAIDDNILFILEEPGRTLMPSEEEIAEVFFVSTSADKVFVFNEVNNYVVSMLETNRSDSYEEYYIDHIGNKYKTADMLAEASDIEKPFIDEIKRRSMNAQNGLYENQSEGAKDLKSSSWDKVIENRCMVWDAGTQRANIAFLLANCYQRYALEYQTQHGDTGTILCYYTYSIIWTWRALQFSDTNVIEYYPYLAGRYRDIAENADIKERFGAYQEQAEVIYEALQYMMSDYVIIE